MTLEHVDRTGTSILMFYREPITDIIHRLWKHCQKVSTFKPNGTVRERHTINTQKT